jgi:hypothetical protein
MNRWILITLVVLILLLVTGYPMIGVAIAASMLVVYFILPQDHVPYLPSATATLQTVDQPAPLKVSASAAADMRDTTMPPAMPAVVPPYGQCVEISGQDTYEGSVPQPLDVSSTVVLESDPFQNPGQVDRMCEAQWFPRNQTRNLKEQQRDDFALQRAMRRDMEWGDVKVWTAQDKAKYEKARQRMEKEIAGALRPDKYMIPEIDENRDYSSSTDQPFASVLSDHNVFHTAHFRAKATNTGSIAGLLRTVI